MTVSIGSDHAGVALKKIVSDYLLERGHVVKDYGPSGDERTHYVDAAEAVATAVAGGESDRGVLICGTGLGMSIAANKVPGIRAALCNCAYAAKMSRRHNDANVLCLGARVTGEGLALDIAEAWLNADFEGGRHQTRLDMIADLESRK